MCVWNLKQVRVNVVLLASFIAGSLVIASQCLAANTSPLSEFDLAAYQYCGEAKDCVIAVNGCCDCANGGIEVAVNKDRLEAFQKRFDCLNVKCADEPADPPCGSGVVSCINHKCKYFPDTDQ